MGHSQGYTIYWDTNLVSINLRIFLEIIPSIFSDHNGMKLKISYKKKPKKSQICGD